MFTVLILFGKPVDESAFDNYFEQHHCPLAIQLPGLQTTRINRVVGAVEGESTYHLTLELGFESAEMLQDGLNSEIGQEMAQDYKHFASGGVNILICELDAERQ